MKFDKSLLRTRACHAALATALLIATPTAVPAQEAAAQASQQAVQAGVPAWDIASSELPADPAIRFGRLANGMRYALMHHETPKGAAAMRFAFDVGAREERPGELGAAHFVEHMAFNGSQNIPEGELLRRLERLGLAFGADTNAETGVEHTTYKLDLPRTDDTTVDAGLDILREMASRLTIAPDAVEREKGIIQSEARVRNVPQRYRAGDMLDTILPDLGIGKRLVISPDEIAQTDAADLRAFYEGYYRPERATLVIVGDFDVDAMEAKVRSTFADWQATGPARESFEPPVVPVSEPRIGTYSAPSIPEIVELARVAPYTPPRNSVAEERRDLMLIVASLAVTNRLNALARQPDATILGGQMAASDIFRSADSIGVLVVAKDGEWKSGLAIAEQEMRRAYEHGFTPGELAEAKANLATQLANAAQQKAGRQSGAIAEEIATASLADMVPTAPETRLAVFQALEPTITPEAVHEAFRDAWRGGPTGIHVATKQPIANPQQAIAAQFAQSAQLAVAAPVEQETAAFAYSDFGTPGKVVADERIADLGIRTIRFANGLQLNLKKTDFEPGKVAFRMQVGQGNSAFPTDRQGLGYMLNLVTSVDGLEAHDIEELRRITAGKQVAYGLANSPGAILAQGVTTGDDLAFQLQLLAAELTAAGYRPETQAQWAAAVPVLMQNFGADAAQVFALALNSVLAGNDARFGITDLASLTSLDLEDLKATIGPQLADGPIAIGLVGDFDEDAAIAAVAGSLGALPQRASRSDGKYAATAQFAADRSVRVLHHSGAADQGLLSVSWPTSDDSDLASSLRRSLLAAVFELRAIEEIREKLGATYTPTVVSTASDTFRGFGHITAYAPADPAQMNLVAQTMRSIAEDLAATPPSEDEILRARSPMLESLQRQERQNAGWTAVVAQAQSYPGILDRRRQRRAILEGIDAAALQAEAARWFAEMPIELRVLPEVE